jgi:Flp pilus assembly protein TadD
MQLGDAGKWKDAIAEFNEAVDICAEHADAYAYRGSAYAEMGDSHRAKADLEKAITLTRNQKTIAEIEDALKALRERD